MDDKKLVEQQAEEENIRNIVAKLLRKEDHELTEHDVAFLRARRDYADRENRRRIDGFSLESKQEQKPQDEGNKEANSFPGDNQKMDDDGDEE